MSSSVDRIVILRTLGAVAVAAGLAVACSSAETSVDPGGDGGVDGGDPVDGAVPLPATCTDASKSGDETDIDCGGACAKCGDSKRCVVGGDCASGVCIDTGEGKKCQAPSPTDGAKNGDETDVDCGGTGNPKCGEGKGCGARADCASDVCTAGKCAAPSPADGAKNGTETDVDCGGPTAPRCNDQLACGADDDCKSDVCKDLADGKGKRCQVPTATDAKKNGAETDVDCGGGTAPACATGLSCLVGDDCTSLGCNYLKKCAAGRSCTRRFGGDTCGLGGPGGDPAVAQQWEDCCTQAPVTPLTNPGIGVAVNVDKYQVTAGRMRAFLESVNYDVRAFVQQARAAGKIPVVPGNALGYTVLEPSWDLYLPTSFAGNQDAGEIADGDQGNPTTPQAGLYTSVSNHLGGRIFKKNAQGATGCYVGSTGGGTHAFRFPDNMQDGPMPSHDQDLYDTKSMQCIDYLVAQAFCVWDGGRLTTLQEWQAAWGPTTAMPWSAETTQTPAQPAQRCDAITGACLSQGDKTYWGCRFPWATDANHPECGLTWPATTTIEYAAYRYLYEYPKLIGNDYIVFISAPGRTRGRGPTGHADIIGTNYSITSTVAFPAATYDGTPFTATHRWTGSGSWEVHAYSRNGGGNTMLLNKYGKLGLRCAHP